MGKYFLIWLKIKMPQIIEYRCRKLLGLSTKKSKEKFKKHNKNTNESLPKDIFSTDCNWPISHIKKLKNEKKTENSTVKHEHTIHWKIKFLLEHMKYEEKWKLSPYWLSFLLISLTKRIHRFRVYTVGEGNETSPPVQVWWRYDRVQPSAGQFGNV
jgi:hypothetical protein